MRIIIAILLLSFSQLLVNCHHNPEDDNVAQLKQLNISILLDLSDRINKKIHPFQEQIDTENVKTIVSIFKNYMQEIGVYEAKSKMKIFFYPPPTNNDIISIAKRLNVDFSKIDSTSLEGISEKIKLFQSFDKSFIRDVKKLYQYATHSSEYPGADIWTFFNDEIEDQCIEKSLNYRNILVIITDGYIYWEPNLRNPIGNRFTYITAKSPHFTKFRVLRKLESDFDKEDYGFVDVKKDLNNLEVLVLGIDPARSGDFDIIKKYWEKWFKEMKIKSNNMKIVKTELPIKTNIIENFFDK